MKNFKLCATLAAAVLLCAGALPARAAGPITVGEDIIVSGDYDWDRLAAENITLTSTIGGFIFQTARMKASMSFPLLKN